MPQTIGFIGLGSLGTPIGLNLRRRGHELFVYNRTAAKTASLVAEGARACATIDELASQCQVVFTMVSDDAAIKSVVRGGLLDHLGKGGLHISMSTILPQTAKELADIHRNHGQDYVAAPVFGRPEAAMAGRLNFVVSGQDEARKRAEPLLKDAGAMAVWDFGSEITHANSLKLCGNFLIAAALEAIGESTMLAQRSGLDTEKMWDMFTKTLFAAPVYQSYSSIIRQEKFDQAGFTARLGLKDLNLVMEQGAAVKQRLPLANLLRNNMQALVNAGKPDIDWSAVSTGAQFESLAHEAVS